MSFTTPGPAEPTGVPAPGSGEPPPPKVVEAAASRQLGPLVVGQQGSNPFGNLLFGFGAAVVIAGLSILAMWGGAELEIRAIAVLGCLGIVISVIVLIYSVMALLAGFTSSYLYANGIVHVKNGKVEAAAWSEVDELWLWKSGGKTALAGKLMCFYVVTFDGRKIPVEPMSKSGDRTLGEQLQQIVRNLGRPVKDSGPYVGRLRP